MSDISNIASPASTSTGLFDPVVGGPNMPQGTYRGQNILAPPSMRSLIKDAMEELSVLAGDKAGEKERERRTLISRSQPTKPRTMNRVIKVTALMEAMKNSKLKPETDALYNKMRQEEMSLGEFTAALHGALQDVSEQYVALESITQRLEKDGGNQKQKDLVAAGLKTLMSDHGPEVRAGLNITPRAYATAKGNMDETQKLRDLYRDSVIGYQGLRNAYTAVVGHFGTDHVLDGVNFLLRAASDDLHAVSSPSSGSAGPSLDKIKFQNIVDELFEMRTLATLHSQSGQLVERMQRMCNIFKNVKSEQIMVGLLEIANQEWPDSGQLINLGHNLGAHEPSSKINFLRELRSIAEQLPFKIFTDNESRNTLIEAFRDAQDIADDEESGEQD